MRLSTSTNIMCFDQGENYAIPIADSVRGCGQAGYRYIDANLCALCRNGQSLTMNGWEKRIEELKGLAETLGMTFSQAHAYFPIGIKFDAQGNRSDGEYGEEMMRRSVLAAEILAIPWMVVHPLTMESDAGYSYKKSFAYNKEYYTRQADFFARHHVNMAIENMSLFGGKIHYCSTADELLELVDALNHPHVGICVDTGHAHLAKQDVAQFLRMVAPWLHATHIADNCQTGDDHVAPFQGTVNWEMVIRTLKEIEYQDDFSFEIQNHTSGFPKEVQQKLVDFSYELGCYLMQME